MITVLLVEDDKAIREMLCFFLTGKNYQVRQAEGGEQALDSLATSTPDLILLDWMLPDISGPLLLKKIRRDAVLKDIPVIMLTARAEEDNKIQGLEAGADDYMTKPVSLKELHARIRALIRRSQSLDSDDVITQGLLSLAPANHLFKINGKLVKIGQTEFRLMQYFMQKPERLHSRAQLLDQVWGQAAEVEERTVDVHILRLRKILKPFGLESVIQTVRGVGYRFSIKSRK